MSACLDRFLSGEWTLDDCLRRFPREAESLREYLALGRELEAMRPGAPSEASLNFGRRLVLSELDRMASDRRSRLAPGRMLGALGGAIFRSRLATTAAAFLIAIVVGSGVTLAAAGSDPESPLYEYKLALENVQVQFSAEHRKADLYADQAETRLRELESLVRRGDTTHVKRVSSGYSEAVENGLSSLRDLSAGSELAELQEFARSRSSFVGRLEFQRDRLSAAVPNQPDVEAEPIAIALNTVRSGLERVPTEPPAAMMRAGGSTGVVTAVVEIPVTATPLPTAAPALAPTESPTVPAEPSQTPTGEVDRATTPAGEQAEPPHLTATAATQPAPPGTTPVRIEGTIEAVSDAAIEVDGKTILLSTSEVPELKVTGKPVVGLRAEVAGLITSDGRILAVEVKVSDGPDGGTEAGAEQTPSVTPTPAVTPTGEATAQPTESPTPSPVLAPTSTPPPSASGTPTTRAGTAGVEEARFEIAGTVSSIGPTSIIVGRNPILLADDAKVTGELALGAFVRAKGLILPGNLLAASEVTVEVAAGGAPAETTVTPIQTSTPSGTPTATPAGTLTTTPAASPAARATQTPGGV